MEDVLLASAEFENVFRIRPLVKFSGESCLSILVQFFTHILVIS